MWLWVVAACAALIWWAVNRESGGKGGGGGRHGGGGGGKGGGGKLKRWFNFVLFLLAITAVMQAPLLWFDITFAQIGANVAQWAFGLVGVAAVLGVLAEVGLWAVLIAAVFDLWGQKVDKIARMAVVVAPVLAILSVGPVGNGVESALDSLNSGSVQLVQDLAQ